MNTRAISVVVPVYNSESTLSSLVERLRPVLQECASEYELVMVNDGSRDQSWQVITNLASAYSWIRGINLARNYGQHNAVICGIRHARYRIVVTIDDDLQHPPEEIPALLRKLDEGADVVYGTPAQEQHGLWRDLASQMTKLALQGAMGIETARSVSAFRALRTEVREAFTAYKSPFVSVDVLLTWGTTRFASVAVRHDPRHSGMSNYTLRKLITHTMNMLTGFSTWPLQFASMVGFLFTLFGIAVLLFVISRFIVEGRVVAGFPFLASIIAIFAGAQLFAIGVIGEYLARMHFRMMEKPLYVIRQTTESKKLEESQRDREVYA